MMLQNGGVDFKFSVPDKAFNRQIVQPSGVLHEGALLALVATLGSVATNCVVDRQWAYCVGQSITDNHIRLAKGGYVTGIARPY
jgi:uncharacterized protein (TIGR00369 family)